MVSESATTKGKGTTAKTVTRLSKKQKAQRAKEKRLKTQMAKKKKGLSEKEKADKEAENLMKSMILTDAERESLRNVSKPVIDVIKNFTNDIKSKTQN